jgi:uncharacterized protein (DUF58 family)
MTTLALTLWPWPPRVRLIRGQASSPADVDAAVSAAVRAAYIGYAQDPPVLLMTACAGKARAIAAERGWRTRRREGVRK